MALKARRKEKETSQNLIRRFSKMIRQSGLLLEIRKRRAHQRPKSPQAKKRAALRKKELKEKYKRLKKLSKVKEQFRK
jgi:ribosomal protein S21